jgi:YihY family inner membrane protein
MVSAVIPFSFILLVGLGLILITIISGVLHGLEDEQVRVFGLTWQLSGLSGLLLYLLGVLGLALLLTSLYLVMPVGHLALRHAFAGGLAAALLWEIARHVLVWYFARLSLVNVVYGSFATVIVILISFELGALILLLGAQVIAELERGEDDGDFET